MAGHCRRKECAEAGGKPTGGVGAKGVTAMPCPMGRLPIEDPEYLSSGRTRPDSSPGRSTPVGLPNPKRRTQASKGALPSRWPIVTAPTFEDCWRIPAVLSVTGPRGCDSPISRSATLIVGARLNCDSGVTLPSSSAPATVKALKVEPGS